jgi:hypothetical protein
MRGRLRVEKEEKGREGKRFLFLPWSTVTDAHGI